MAEIIVFEQLSNHIKFHHMDNFLWLGRGLDKSDELRMGWYDSSMVRGGSDFKVDIKRDYRGDIREYFREFSYGLRNGQVWFHLKFKGSYDTSR